MRILPWSIVCVLSLASAHCSSGSSQTGTTTSNADGGSGRDASDVLAIPSTCVSQGPQVTALYCSKDEFLILCDAAGAVPPAPCKRAVPEGGYCCPVPSVQILASLLVCANPDGGTMKDTLRFSMSHVMDDGKLDLALFPLESTERTVTGKTAGRALLLDAAPTSTSFLARGDKLEVPASVNPKGVALSFKDITLSGALPLHHMIAKALITQPEAGSYRAGCVLLEGSQDAAITVTDEAVTFGSQSAVLAQMTPPAGP
ncbi:MAG: hypothetical protein U0174_15900 [Polyangiaceae bacterium]